MGWEYFNAGMDSTTSLVKEPWEWVQLLNGALQDKPLKDFKITSSRPDGTTAQDPSGAPTNPPVTEPVDSTDVACALEQVEQAAKSDVMATIQANRLNEGTGTTGEDSVSNTAIQQQPSNMTAATAPKPNEEHVQRLVQMGFERAEAIAALEAMGGDVDGAASLLIE